MEFKLDNSSSTPLHEQAEKALRELIKREEYQKGKLLPSEVIMSEQFGISRNTLRYAINKLVSEGLLDRRKGHGTKVVTKGISGRAKNWLSFSQEMQALGMKVYNFELHISWKVPSDEVLAFFDLEEGTKVLTLERLRGKEEFPFVYFISYFNPQIGITGNENFGLPLYNILEEKYGVVVSLSSEEVSAIKATSFLSDKLNLNINEPVLFRKRLVFDKQKMPIEYNLGYYRGDSFVYTFESQRM